VFNDANVGSLVLVSGGTLPGVVEWIDTDAAATGIYTRGFAVNESGSGSIEIPHDYKEGSNITFHVHWGVVDAPTGTDYVKWQLKYFVSDPHITSTTPIVVEDTAPAQYHKKRTDFAAISGTGILIGYQFNFNIARIAAVGDAFAGEAYVETIGFHYEADTIGSSTIIVK
jgi:hypothetical protein